MLKIYFFLCILVSSLSLKAQCLTATSGQYPAATFTPACGGTVENITAAGYAGEYSKVNVTSGVTYNFSSSVSSDFVTISDEAGTTAYASGNTGLVWTATLTGVIRFYLHTNSACGEASVNRTRAIQCPFPTCTAPTAQPTGLTLTPGLTTVAGTFTAAAPAPTNYLVVRYAVGGGSTPALPANNATYLVGNAITGAGLSTGTVVSLGSSSTFNATGLSPSTTYDFIVFSYNAGSCAPVYRTTITAGQNKGTSTTTNCPALGSTVTVGATGNYNSLTAIGSVLGGCPVAAPLSIQILNDYTSAGETFPITFNPIAGASATNNVTIKPAAGAIMTITGNAASQPILKILSSYVTLDGSNNGTTSRDLTISNTSVTSPNVLLVGSNGATPITNVAIKNTNLINGINTSSAVIVSDAATPGTAGYFNNISLLNNSVQKAYIGIYAIAFAAAGNGSGLTISNNDLSTSGTNAIRYVGIYAQAIDGATVSNNTIGNFDAVSAEIDRGVWFATGMVNSTISGNTITNLGYTGTGANAPVGLYISTGSATSNVLVSGNTITGLSSSGNAVTTGVYALVATAGVTIEKNKISNIKNSNAAGGAYGIRMASTATTGTNTIANNFIFDVASLGSATVANNGHGIAIVSGISTAVYYNSVNLNTDQTNVAGLPSAFFVSSGVTTAGAITAKNNIFVNSQAVGVERYTIYSGAANTVFASTDYNDYYTGGPNLGYIGSNRTDLAAIQAGFGGNGNSKAISPVFASATDLHLPTASNAALANLGSSVPGFTTDIDNQLRSSSVPDMGADEFDVALPVTLLTFSGERKADMNLLRWSVLTEINVAGFELQRSANGIDFIKLEFIASKSVSGNSNTLIQYDYADARPLAGSNYYRLKQIDKDGRFIYSRIVTVNSKNASGLVFGNLYPNPAKNLVTATVEIPVSTQASFVITNIEGKAVMSRTAKLQAGDNQLNFDVSRLSPGTYFIKLLCASGCESISRTFIKQ